MEKVLTGGHAQMTSAQGGRVRVAQNLTKTDMGRGKRFDSDDIFETHMNDHLKGLSFSIFGVFWDLKMRLFMWLQAIRPSSSSSVQSMSCQFNILAATSPRASLL